MFDVQDALAELDRWKDIPTEDDQGHTLVYQVMLECGVLSRIAEGDTNELLSEVIALLQHRGLTERQATMALDDVFFGLGLDWGEKWTELFRCYRE